MGYGRGCPSASCWRCDSCECQCQQKFVIKECPHFGVICAMWWGAVFAYCTLQVQSSVDGDTSMLKEKKLTNVMDNGTVPRYGTVQVLVACSMQYA